MISKILFTFLLLWTYPLFGQTSMHHVHSIKIEGLKRTKIRVVQREILIKKDSVYSTDELKALLERTNEKLLNTNLFKTVDHEVSFDSDSTVVTFSIIEKWYTWPMPFLEFSDRNFNVWNQFDFDPSRTNYGLYFFNYNLFGSNHTLKISLIEGYHQRVGLEYRVPYISTTSPWGISGKFYTRKQDEVWLQTREDVLNFYKTVSSTLIQQDYAEVKTGRWFSPDLRVDLRFGWDHTQLSDSVLAQEVEVDYHLNGKAEQDRLFAETSLSFDTRDNIYLPMAGTYLVGVAGVEQINSDASIQNLRLSVTAQKFLEMGNGLGSAFSFIGVWNSNPELPYTNYRMLGYDLNLRGYEKFVVDGHSGFVFTSALRQRLYQKNFHFEPIPIFKKTDLPFAAYLEYFMEGGYVNNIQSREVNELPNQLLLSTGIGLQTLFYNDRVFRFELSLNSLQQLGFNIHFKKAI